jgi:uncharacterized protein (UPF0335 family)
MSDDPIAHGQLRAFVERLERMDEELRAINDDKKEIFAEAKGNGFDTKALKVVLRNRRMDPSERNELHALVDLYESALSGKLPDGDEPHRAPAPAHAREIIEEFPRPTPSHNPEGQDAEVRA